jgi:hypothetical protein
MCVSLNLFKYLFLCTDIFYAAYVSVILSDWQFVFSLFVYVFIRLFVRLAICLLSFCLYVCSSFCLFVYRLLFVFQFVRLFVCPSTFCLFVCPSFCLSVFLFACNNFLFTENVWHTRWRAHRQNANKPEKSSFSLLRLPFHSLQVLSFCHYMDLLGRDLTPKQT